MHHSPSVHPLSHVMKWVASQHHQTAEQIRRPPPPLPDTQHCTVCSQYGHFLLLYFNQIITLDPNSSSRGILSERMILSQFDRSVVFVCGTFFVWPRVTLFNQGEFIKYKQLRWADARSSLERRGGEQSKWHSCAVSRTSTAFVDNQISGDVKSKPLIRPQLVSRWLATPWLSFF